MIVAVLADTHLPRGTRRLPEACVARLREADAVLHAGDVATAQVLAELEALGSPVHAVAGNVDEPALQERLAHQLVIDLGGARVGMVHDAGRAEGRLERLRARFADADAVVFGHSHVPLHDVAPDGFQIFNPGSPTDRRRQPRHTMGVARIEGGALAFETVTLD